MKSNLKEQVADLQKELQELTERFETLLNRIDNHLVPRLQHHDNDLIECKTANSFLTGIQNAVMTIENKLVDLRDKFWQDPTLSQISELEKRVKQLEGDSK